MVIGGGFGGLLAGARLREAGVEDVRIIEKGGDFGGTWYWNRYPGAMCDVESYIYLPLLEELGYVPTEKYARAPEILAHSQAIGRKYDLYRGACFQTEVTEMRWDEDSARWIVATNRGDRHAGALRVHVERAAQSAEAARHPRHRVVPRATRSTPAAGTTRYTGGDSERQPDGPARQARRHHRHRRDGRAVRAAPRRGGRASLRLPAHAVVDRRARQPPHRSGVGAEPRSPAGTSTAWTTSTSWSRAASRRRISSATAGPTSSASCSSWCSRTRARASRPDGIAKTMELADFQKMEQIRARVDAIVEDPETAEALKPYYRQFCKRPCFHDEYLDTFNRPNVTLVDTQGQGRRAHHGEGRRRRRRRVRARLPDLRHRLRGRHGLHAPRGLRDLRARRPRA